MNQDLLNDPVFTIPELATYLKISKAKLYYLAQRKKLPHIKMGRNIRVRMSDLRKWLDEQVEKAE